MVGAAAPKESSAEKATAAIVKLFIVAGKGKDSGLSGNRLSWSWLPQEDRMLYTCLPASRRGLDLGCFISVSSVP